MKSPENAWKDYVKSLPGRETVNLTELMKMKAAFMAGYMGGLDVFRSKDTCAGG